MSTVESRRRIAVFALGGTIAMTDNGSGAVTPTLSAEQLVAAVPGLDAAGAAIEVIDFRQKPGASLTPTDIAELAAAIHARLPEIDGAVVTQGTDTIEETAYLLDLLHTAPIPVVVTGAMRNPTLAGADGPANLLAAIRTAAAPALHDQGSLVVFNDEIHAADRVRKTHTTSTATFTSPNGGPLGYITESQPHIFNRRAHRLALPPTQPQSARIPIITTTLGDDSMVVDTLAPHIDGLVVAGFGAGHVPANLVAPLEGLATRVPVILASRTGSGTVLSATYGFSGSEQDLLARGLIRAGYLDPLKSRILLHALLAVTSDRAQIAAAFAAAGGYSEASVWPWLASTDKEF
ncbi:asparaginase [Nocardia cyriacigeorgica]|uniref:asparaginase n=1 Tax=Nocardia cyriacigeorgica TaxID=135487 RepID=UPI001C67BC5C|nr:asparaginase [Nocardia cyriacigeorgica]